MAIPTEERIERTLRRLLSRPSQSRERVNCPDEESLAGYLGGTLSAEQRSAVEQHLSGCSFCLDEIAAVNKATQEAELDTAPQWLMACAMGLKPAQKAENVFDLAVRLLRNTVELVSTAGEWVIPVSPQPVAVRGSTSETGILRVEKKISGYRFGIEVERVESGCEVLVSVATADGTPQDGIRLSLMSGDREQASYLTRQGKAVFESVLRGEYKLTISQAGMNLGTINLEIEEEP